MIPLRPYQADLNGEIRAHWNAGQRNVVAQLPTGGGKTVNMADLFAHHQGASIGIAHRQELVSQMSLALARFGIRHRVIGQKKLIAEIVRIHMDETGRSFYDPNAWCGVAGVDTLVRRGALADPWFQQITLWQTDEAHHVLRENKWGRACLMFPNARGVGWTATPGRADGYGLGRDADGLFDAMVTGPDMRWLIDNGYLTDYKIWCPPADIDLSGVNVTDSGDFSQIKLREAVHKSHIVGDVVQHYQRIAGGKLGVTFAVDIEHAVEMAAAYRSAGISAEVVTSETPDTLRAAILRRFRSRQVLQLVNVDLFGEGFDLPAIEVVSMARPTASLNLFRQQAGRALRLLEGKQFGIIIDHVGNVVRHGLPDSPKVWTLARRERRGAHTSQLGVIPMRVCPNCTAPYERLVAICPFCQWKPEPAGRDMPEQVDGDLMELSAAALQALRGEVSRIDGPVRVPVHLQGTPAGQAVANNHLARQQAQAVLRATMDRWGWWRTMYHAENDSMVQRRFFFQFGIDVLSARALGAPDAEALRSRVQLALDTAGVVAAA